MLPKTNQLTAEGCGSRKDAKVCRSRGGESCAFDGAMIVLQPIADSAQLVHGPIACCGNSWEGRGSLSDKGTLHRMGFTTDLDELDIVYGSEEKLYRAVLKTYDEVRPKAIFVHQTCVSGLTGEDVEAVARKAASALPVPVIPVNAPGFVGPKNLGNRIAGQALLEHVIGTGEPAGLRGSEINIIGEYNIAGDLLLIEPLLEEAGVRVLSRITGNATFEEITHAHRARLNVIACSRALINVPREMQRKFGIPYVEASFFGRTEMSKALRAIAGKLGDKEIAGEVERIIEREEERLTRRIEKFGYFKGRRAVLYSGGVKSWSMISALHDLGFEIAAVGTKKSTAEDEEKMRALLGDDAPLVENTAPKNLLRLMKEHGADLMVAGGRNLYLGAKEGFPFIDVNQERHTAYAGYDGLVNLAEDIHRAMKFYGLAPSEAIRPAVEEADMELSTNPLKHSQAIGAAMALQGVDAAVPVLHGAQGCNFLGKVLLTKHFREPIALVSTKLFAEDVVLGSEGRLSAAVEQAARDQKPELICVLSTGLTEVKGDDVRATLRGLNFSVDADVLHISTPDFEGGLETGYAKAVEGLIALADARPTGPRLPEQINVLAGPHLSPADFLEVRETVASFGLRPLMLPDLSALDGSREGFSALAIGGISVEDIRKTGHSGFTIAIGGCMEGPAALLKEDSGIEYKVLRGLAGLEETDLFMELLSALSGMPWREDILRRRKVLNDAMRDAYPMFGGKRVCLALDPSHAVHLSRWLNEMGAEVALAVIPHKCAFTRDIIAEKVVIGDIGSIRGDFDLIVSNSHAQDAARELGVPLYQAGFPVYKRFGATTTVRVLYRGTLNLLNALANIFMEVR